MIKMPPNVAEQIRADLDDIRLLIQNIESPEAFDAMIARILDPAMQREVKTLLIPLLPFRYGEAIED